MKQSILFAFFSINFLIGQTTLPSFLNTLPGIHSGQSSSATKTSPMLDPKIFSGFIQDDFPILKSQQTLASLQQDSMGLTRSSLGSNIFRMVAPSVVLIVTEDSLGSGTLINSKGEILTNLHVVGSNNEVGVIFKPLNNTEAIDKKTIRRARVIKIDEVTDLALIQVLEFPSSAKPISLAESYDVNIGADVHAIGHPNGESWTYTAGVISQYRIKYKWLEHQADVIQTQTPINPGNSGGPLITDKGRIIGVNSFKGIDTEGLNFAVSVNEIRDFISRSKSRYRSASNVKPRQIESAKNCEEPKQIDRGREVDQKGKPYTWYNYDTNCDGQAEFDVIVPDDKSEDVYIRVDRNGDKVPDVIYAGDHASFDLGKMIITLSIWDTNYDGVWDITGFHPDGSLKPSRFEKISRN